MPCLHIVNILFPARLNFFPFNFQLYSNHSSPENNLSAGYHGHGNMVVIAIKWNVEPFFLSGKLICVLARDTIIQHVTPNFAEPLNAREADFWKSPVAFAVTQKQQEHELQNLKVYH